MRYPSIKTLRKVLTSNWKYIRKTFNKKDLEESSNLSGTDVRLQVTDNGWQVHTGSSDYDTDHRGAWGNGFIGYDKQNLTALAKDLIAQAKDGEAFGLGY